MGIGLEGKLFGGAIGKVSESRFEFRDADEVERAERGSWGDIETEAASMSTSLPSREDRDEDRACGSVAVVLASASMASSEEEAAGLEEPRRRQCCSKAICVCGGGGGGIKEPKSLWNERQYEACVQSWIRANRVGSGLPVPPLWARRCLCLSVIDLRGCRALARLLLSCLWWWKRVLEQVKMEQICS